MLIRDDITFKHGKCLKNERIIALYSLLLISLQKQQNQIISTVSYTHLTLPTKWSRRRKLGGRGVIEKKKNKKKKKKKEKKQNSKRRREKEK
ncbi:hypothetical protein, partial [Escherichia coli]|uniref:hypothetical protein n=1 Tax=Escherichia coli TaxID=562 RepID=UPI000BB7C43E